MDVDRGYYPRHAFIDGRFNARAAALTFAMVNARLSDVGELTLDSEASDEERICFSSTAGRYELVSGQGDLSARVEGSHTVTDLLEHPQLDDEAGQTHQTHGDHALGCQLIEFL